MKPLHFLFISHVGLHVDLAWQVQKEGHEIKYYIDEKDERLTGDGFIPKVTNWRAEVDWADVIVFDDTNGHGTLAAELRKKGKAVIGGTPYTDRLEDDRGFGQSELKQAGVNTILSQDFTNFDEGIKYVQEHPAAYVIKPSGEAQNTKHLLFVGMEDDGSDVIDLLQIYKKTWANVIKIFQLQKKATGVEVAIGAFFNGNRFLEPININFEHKKLFPGNVGPSTGEMGTSMFWSKPNKMFNSTLKKLEAKLREEKFAGYIDINTMVNGNGIYPLEFTSRFGYPTIQIQTDSITTPIGQFLYDLANGVNTDFKVKKGFSVGVRIVVPPFPFEDKKTYRELSEDAGILFKKRDQQDGVHIEGVRKINGIWSCAASDGTALIVTGQGATMKQAQMQAYRRVQNVLIPNMYYRSDIGDRWPEDSDRLMGWGYLSEA
ncbi:MAG: phosphoribosylglycinamide synthetase C domain-containing protein [Candidatus Paceibacterota bacterium]|jgi:phosphoribosylamine--glycine ligase|nr:phosphoribosylamine--glycine ligase [Candidatus Paceibacterota bacterium]